MLKWTVNTKRGDLLPLGETNPFEITSSNFTSTTSNMRDLPSSHHHRTRRSLGTYSRLSLGKENLVSNTKNCSPRTPLPRHQQQKQLRRQSLGVLLSSEQQSKQKHIPMFHDEADKENNNSFFFSPPIKSATNVYGAFRDVSNITPTSTPTSNTIMSRSSSSSQQNSRRRKRSFSQLQTPAAALDGETTTTVAPQLHQQKLRNPSQYASTLPTFDIEYSPFGLMRHTAPFLDTYFNQPRYITPQVMVDNQEENVQQPATKKQKITATSQLEKPKSPSEPPMTPLSHRMHDVMTMDSTPVGTTGAKMNASQKRPRKFFFINNNSSLNKFEEEEEESPTSTDVGDLTLDHMIDAILESARKEPARKVTRRRFSCNFKLEKPKHLDELKSHFGRVKDSQGSLVEESPTYTAADDPASDLGEEFLRCESNYPLLERVEEKISNRMERTMVEVEQLGETEEEDDKTVMFNEREVKTPDSVVQRRAGDEAMEIIRVVVNGNVEEEEKKTKEPCDDECALRRQNALRRKTAKNYKPFGLTTLTSEETTCEVKPINMELVVDGGLDLAFFAKGNKLIVHVLSCKDVETSNGSINAVVKVALLPMENSHEKV